MTDPTPTEDQPAQWEPTGERRITWAGDLSIDAERSEAILTITLLTEERHFLRIPRSKLEALGNDLDWARHRLTPWPERGGQS